MNDSNADDRCDASSEERFTLSYRCGDYRATVTFDNSDCPSVISNVANFLLGCGFSPNNIIECMAESAASLDDAWLTKRPAKMDQELIHKWNLGGE
jgi:hypothetical protein